MMKRSVDVGIGLTCDQLPGALAQKCCRHARSPQVRANFHQISDSTSIPRLARVGITTRDCSRCSPWRTIARRTKPTTDSTGAIRGTQPQEQPADRLLGRQWRRYPRLR